MPLPRSLPLALLIAALAGAVRAAFTSAPGSGPCEPTFPCCSTYPCASALDNANLTRVGMLFVLSGSDAASGRPNRKAVELAIDDVNAQGMIPGLHMIGVYGDDQGASVPAFSATFSLLRDEPLPLVIGPGYSSAAQMASLVAGISSTPLVSGSATSPALSDKATYKTFTRTAPSDATSCAAVAYLFARLRWTLFATFAVNNAYGANAFTAFQSAALRLGLAPTVALTIDNTAISSQLRQARAAGIRILFVIGNLVDIQNLWTAAADLGMTTAPYVWVISATISALLAASTNGRYVGVLAVHPYVNTSATAYAQFTARWQALHAANPAQTYNAPLPGSWSYHTYDAVWLAANAMRSMIVSAGANFSSTDLVYQRTLRQQLLSTLYSTSFEGLTGTVSLDASGDRVEPSGFYSLQYDAAGTNLVWASVGVFSLTGGASNSSGVGTGDNSSLTFDQSRVLWPGGRVGVIPLDRPVSRFTFQTVSSVQFWIIASLCILGLVFVASLAVWTLVNWAEPVVRASAPRINLVMFVGAVMIYVSAILQGVDASLIDSASVSAMCMSRLWVAVIGFTLSFGGLLAKTYRVHAIFNNTGVSVITFSDLQVLFLIGAQLLVDVVIMLVWHLVDPLRTESVLGTAQTVDLDLVLQPMTQQCVSPQSTTFFFSLFAWKGATLLLGFFLAYQTRLVSIPAINDSREVGLSIYTTTLVSVMAVPAAFIAGAGNAAAAFALSSVAMWLVCTATLVVLFAPKVWAVYKGEQDELMSDTKRMSSMSKRGSLLRRSSTMGLPAAGSNAVTSSALEMQPLPPRALIDAPATVAQDAIELAKLESAAVSVDEAAQVQVVSERVSPTSSAALPAVEVCIASASDNDAEAKSPASVELEWKQQQQQQQSASSASTVVTDAPALIRIPSVARAPIPQRTSYLVSRAKSVSLSTQ